MERLPSELVLCIVQNLSIGDSVNFFSTCRRFIQIGASFVEGYLRNYSVDTQPVPAEKLTVVATVTRFLNPKASINKGVPFSIRPIAFGVEDQFMCYRGLTCCLQSGSIRIYSNYNGTLEYSIDIGDIELQAASTGDRGDTEHRIEICDFNHHILAVNLNLIQSLVSIKLEGRGSWRIVYVLRTGLSRPQSVISSKAIVSWTMVERGLHFNWFDLDEGMSNTLDIDGDPSSVQVVAGGPTFHIGLYREDEDGYKIGQLKLTDKGLIYEPKQEFLHMDYMCSDGRDGVKLFGRITHHGIPVFLPHEEPAFRELSYTYFQLNPNGSLNNIAHRNLNEGKRIWPARVADGVGILYAIEDSKGRSLFFANFDARCEHWNCLKDQQTGGFTLVAL